MKMFVPPIPSPVDIETASALAGSNLDGVAFGMEHAPMVP